MSRVEGGSDNAVRYQDRMDNAKELRQQDAAKAERAQEARDQQANKERMRAQEVRAEENREASRAQEADKGVNLDKLA